MSLHPGEFTDLTNLKEEFFRDGNGRTAHDPKPAEQFSSWRILMARKLMETNDEFASQPGEPTCYCQPFDVSMLTVSGCELKLILKGIF
jgi:hypothetical protein